MRDLIALRRTLDDIVGPFRREAFFGWLMSGSGKRFALVVRTTCSEAVEVCARLEPGLTTYWEQSANFPNNFTVWFEP